jgi:hypothetical protein
MTSIQNGLNSEVVKIEVRLAHATAYFGALLGWIRLRPKLDPHISVYKAYRGANVPHQ